MPNSVNEPEHWRRYIIAAALIAFAGAAGSVEANAQDYCNMGSQTPNSMRAYCANRGSGYERRSQNYNEDRGYRQREYGYEERGQRRSLAYYCGLGDQTPRSMRGECRRAGY